MCVLQSRMFNATERMREKIMEFPYEISIRYTGKNSFVADVHIQKIQSFLRVQWYWSIICVFPLCLCTLYKTCGSQRYMCRNSRSLRSHIDFIIMGTKKEEEIFKNCPQIFFSPTRRNSMNNFSIYVYFLFLFQEFSIYAISYVHINLFCLHRHVYLKIP